VGLRPLAGGEAQPTGLSGTAKPVVSPDGRYVAYVSDETGRNEVYLRRFPSFTGKWQVSTTGGDWPRWGGRADRIYFASDNDVLAVDIEGADAPALGIPRRLFTRPQQSARGVPRWSSRFDVNADGTLFVFGVDVDQTVSHSSLVLAQNWYAPFAARSR
jgi:Tol biopolymer transport system component